MATVNLNDYFAKLYKTLEANEEKRSVLRIKQLQTRFDNAISQEKSLKIENVHQQMVDRILLLIKNEVITREQGQVIAKNLGLSGVERLKKPTAKPTYRTPVGGCAGGARAC